MPSYLRRNPATAAYLAFLLLGHVVIGQALSPDRADDVHQWISTNLKNLGAHPIGALIGSLLFMNGTLTQFWTLEFVGTVITLGIGVGWALARLERRHGPVRAFGAFLLGHVGATLLTAPFIAYAIHRGWYPDSVRTDLDYGISYGTQAALAAATFSLPKRARVFWTIFALAWPLGGAEFFGPVPDFNTIGHLVAAAFGFMIGMALLRQKTRVTELD
ncbi:rhomboid-like protein [Amycolatopsis sp. cg5]|uniref:rhomboid-like protein n=1 Tax=Amycolatopsis sp. cg5 TaxID=3238802 RepID=UPI0035251D7C